jgi:hypothetical protein
LNAITRAVMTREVLWKNIESRSEIPICRMPAVMVMIAAVCPGGKVSSTDIGCLNRAFM